MAFRLRCAEGAGGEGGAGASNGANGSNGAGAAGDANDVMYELHVEKGPATNPSMHFDRVVPLEVAKRFRDGLQAAGVFGWEESYGDATAPGTLRWNVKTVFKEGVFSVASSGGSDVPAGFDALLEELYRMDFPRPDEGRKDPGAFDDVALRVRADALGADYSQLADMMKAGGLPGMDASEMARLLAEAQSNPQALQQRMRDEFRHLPRDEQERMLDALAASGMASRAWWERFLRG